MREFRLLALDLDGTTVRRDGSLGRGARHAITQARRRGLMVSVATGRTYRAADDYAARLGADGPVICCDGGLVRLAQGGALQHAWPIDPATVARVCALAEEAGGGWAAYTDRGRIVGGRMHRHGWRSLLSLLRVAPWHAWNRLRLARFKRAPGGRVGGVGATYKMVVWSLEGDAMAQALRGLPLAFPSGVGRSAIELVAAGVSKGSALAAVAASLDIPRDGVLAFGDGPNDLEMLTWAGWGVAMGNAPSAVRAAAAAVTGTIEQQGFPRALEALWRDQP